jgi:formamidopyrimidine-DNA glycosylase
VTGAGTALGPQPPVETKMHELPEIELLRRELEREVGERKVRSVEVPAPGLLQGVTKKALVADLEGRKGTGAVRRGMLVGLDFDGTHELLLSLGERGQLARNKEKDPTEKGTALIITYTQGGQLRLVDPAKGTTVEWLPIPDVAAAHPELAELGFDAVDEPISWTTFGEALLRRNGKLKGILMDPTFLVGIGPMYSDEILFHAGLRYDRTPQSLATSEIRRLYRAVVETMHDAVKYGGTTLDPDGWVSLNGQPGGYQAHLAVYRRAGEMSPRARGPIVKARFGNITTYFCEQTQV